MLARNQSLTSSLLLFNAFFRDIDAPVTSKHFSAPFYLVSFSMNQILFYCHLISKNK